MTKQWRTFLLAIFGGLCLNQSYHLVNQGALIYPAVQAYLGLCWAGFLFLYLSLPVPGKGLRPEDNDKRLYSFLIFLGYAVVLTHHIPPS